MPQVRMMPMREQLRRATELGHELEVDVRGPWPEHGDPNPKIRIACSCGWKGARVWRNERAANSQLAWHVGYVVGQDLAEQKLGPLDPPAPRVAAPPQAG